MMPRGSEKCVALLQLHFLLDDLGFLFVRLIGDGKFHGRVSCRGHTVPFVCWRDDHCIGELFYSPPIKE